MADIRLDFEKRLSCEQIHLIAVESFSQAEVLLLGDRLKGYVSNVGSQRTKAHKLFLELNNSLLSAILQAKKTLRCFAQTC